MADKAPVATAAQVTLPPGMTKEQFDKLFASFLDSRVAGKARDLAYRSATKDLVTAHTSEFNGYLQKYGYVPTKARG